MSTQQRLDNYLAAEARSLTRGFSLRFGERQRQEAELAEIRKAIAQLQAQLTSETGPMPVRSSLRYHTTVFNK